MDRESVIITEKNVGQCIYEEISEHD